MSGIELIAQERKEQLEKHNRPIENDVAYNSEHQLSWAASRLCRIFPTNTLPKDWNKDLWLKMILKPYKERLIKAGALIAAEIDRLLYIEKLNQLEQELNKEQ